MAVVCPSCQKELGLKGAKPGRYSPKCPRCGSGLLLVVKDDGSAEVSLRAAPDVMATRSPEVATMATAGATAAGRGEGGSATVAMGGAGGMAAGDVAGAAPATAGAGGGDDPLVGTMLGGYEVLEKLGQGGMGAVYLARQVSLDRKVALKTLRPELAKDPDLVARFTREAFAAAQLTHHHVVQIYDIGESNGVHFFAMELVEGKPLSGLVRELGRLDVETAVAYVLQAARGLKAAHDRGMIHRDVKPANLLLSDEGLVKVADLGLVKRGSEKKNGRPGGGGSGTGGLGETGFNKTMGTPAFMAPEQAKDATRVDERADVYSLGCTLYNLLTGGPPYTGRTVEEILTKQATEPPPPVDVVVKNVPAGLAEIVNRMVARNPEQRYRTMAEVIGALEGFLGLKGGGLSAAGQTEVSLIEANAKKFNRAGLAPYRLPLGLAVGAVCVAVGGVMLFSANWAWGLGILTIPLWMWGAREVTLGFVGRGLLLRKLREAWFAGGWGRALAVAGKAAAYALVVLVVLWAIGALGPVLAMAVLGVALGVGWCFGVDMPTALARRGVLAELRETLKVLRQRGMDEEAVRLTVARNAGAHWEELHEALFGYEAKLEARQVLRQGEMGKKRKLFAPWRDWIVRWLEKSAEAARAAAAARHLAKVEARRLAKEGKKNAEAEARELAEAMVLRAADAKKAEAKAKAAKAAGRPVEMSIALVRADGSVQDLSSDERARVRRERGFVKRRYGGVVGLLIGPQARLALGLVVLLGFALWLRQNDNLKLSEWAAAGRAVMSQTADRINEAIGNVSGEDVEGSGARVVVPKDSGRRVPLELPMLPKAVTGLWADFGAGVAGLLLLVSAVFSGIRLGWFVIPGAALLLAGHLLGGMVPSVWVLSGTQVVQAAGLAWALLGLLLVRSD
ncbi:MAG: serine/threonine-protein kinase [Tepidisphaerales bacterium]